LTLSRLVPPWAAPTGLRQASSLTRSTLPRLLLLLPPPLLFGSLLSSPLLSLLAPDPSSTYDVSAVSCRGAVSVVPSPRTKSLSGSATRSLACYLRNVKRANKSIPLPLFSPGALINAVLHYCDLLTIRPGPVGTEAFPHRLRTYNPKFSSRYHANKTLPSRKRQPRLRIGSTRSAGSTIDIFLAGAIWRTVARGLGGRDPCLRAPNPAPQARPE
jgi:hypothetical protein